MALLTHSILDSYLDLHIGDICLNQFRGDEYNHCAHFVGHVLQIGHGKTCTVMVHSSRRVIAGSSLLVDELFDVTQHPQELVDCPTSGQGLIYVSAPGSFAQIGSNVYRIRSVQNRHVGLYLNGIVWHYKNRRRKVVRQPIAEFFNHYRSQRNALWVGDLPAGARPVSVGVCA